MSLPKISGRLFIALSLCIYVAPSVSAQTSVSDVKSAHAAVLKTWLAKKAGWRLAVEKDYGKDNLEFLRGDPVRRLPFYVAADFNGDQKEDFAVILTNARKKYAAVVFNAPFDSETPAPPAFFSSRIETGDIVYFNENSNVLLIGPYASDAGFMLKPDGKKYKTEFSDMGN